MNRKAIIIGAGISGLASAITLSRIGYEVVINEKSPTLKSGGAGITLWNNAINALSQLGITEKLYSKGKIINESKIISSSGKVLSDIPLNQFVKKYGGQTIGILRSQLYSVLLEELSNMEIKTDRRLISVQQDQGKVFAYFENGEVEVGDLLVGADGIHSNVRKQIFKDTKLRSSGYTSWRGVTKYEHEYCEAGFMFEAWGNGIRFGFVPVSNNEVYWFATKNSPLDLKEDLLKSFENFVEPVPATLKLTNTDEIIHTDIFDLKPLSSWTSGRVVLIGDAAHATTPNLGQGACLSIEDAVELAECLQRDGEIETVLKTFEAKRMKRVKRMVKQSWDLGKIAQVENPILCLLRNTLFKATPRSIQQRQFDRTIGYKIK